MNNVTKIAVCWRIKLSNDKLLYFTDADQKLIYKGEVYVCGSYFTPNSIISSNELGQDSFSISGIIDGEYITQESLIAGDLSEGYIEIFLINLDDLLAERVILKTGWLGEIKYDPQSFTAEITSIGGRANNVIGKCYSSSCKVEFASKYCGKNVADYSYDGVVMGLAEVNSFVDSAREEPDGYFSQGSLLFTSGKNYGRKYNVKESREGKISLDFIIDLKIAIGDEYQVIAGCDKAINTCINKFNNAINFRGEPYIPSRHKLVAGD